jgi:hypothetical protein
MEIAEAKVRHPYSDTPSPKRFGAVSSLDPEFFSRIDDFAEALVEGKQDARYSPLWVGSELENAATVAMAALRKAQSKTGKAGPAFQRMAADVEIQCGLGRFFAWKFRAGVLFAIYERTKSSPALREALGAYRKAREAWVELAEAAKSVYRKDVTFGPEYFQRGHWLDRLPAIDEDIREMESLLVAGETESGGTRAAAAENAVTSVLQESALVHRPKLERFHMPPTLFRRGAALRIEVGGNGHHPKLMSVRLRFRHLNQGERWQMTEMELNENRYIAEIPAGYTDSEFPLQYHFELHREAGDAWLFPGFEPGWKGQPYYVVRGGND